VELKHHKDHPDLAGEHKYGDLGQVILFFLFLGLWVIDSFWLHFSDYPSNHVRLYIRAIFGILMLIYSFYVARSGLKIVFGEHAEDRRVISEGIFGRVRHPVYLGAILFYLSLLLFRLSISAAGLWIIIVIFYNYIAAYEEKLLIDKFGDEYRDYMLKVPRWIPRWR